MLEQLHIEDKPFKIERPGKEFPHYYSLYLPFLLIGVVHSLGGMPRHDREADAMCGLRQLSWAYS